MKLSNTIFGHTERIGLNLANALEFILTEFIAFDKLLKKIYI